VSRNFLTLTVSCKCGKTNITGFVIPLDLAEIKSTLDICRAVVKCEFSGVDVIENLGGPRQFFEFARTCRRQYAATLVRSYCGN
jgi:hypothetical protein